MEAIFLLTDAKAPAPARRTPPPRLRNTVTAAGEPFEPLLSDQDWEASLERTARQIAGDAEAFQV